MVSSEKLIVALDVQTRDEALSLVGRLSPEVSYFKVGLELFCAAGKKIVEEIGYMGGKVFLDLKFFDIPNTMASAIKSAGSSGAFLINIHALAGATAMRRCAEAVSLLPKPPKLIAVTLLTSYDEEELKNSRIVGSIPATVKSLCGSALNAGLAGIVASPEELPMLRKTYGNDFLIITPGVRPTWAEANDQKRTATPAEAIKNGADFIVVGRPITSAEDPLKAARKIIKEMEQQDAAI